MDLADRAAAAGAQAERNHIADHLDGRSESYKEQSELDKSYSMADHHMHRHYAQAFALAAREVRDKVYEEEK